MAGGRRSLLAVLVLLLATTGPSIASGAGRSVKGVAGHRRLRQDVREADGAVGSDADAGEESVARPGEPAAARPSYAVSIERPCYPGSHFCGGALVDAAWVVTAASCLHGLVDSHDCGPPSVRVANPGAVTAEAMPVQEQIFHPDWTGSRADGHDVVLLRLDPPLGDALRPIAMADEGIDVLSGPLMEILKHSDQVFERVPGVGIVPNEGCDGLRRRQQLSPVTEDMICGYASGLNSSAGLNGGLLVFTDASNTTQSNGDNPLAGSLLGIASFDRSDRLANEDLPIVFANVAYFSDWVRSVVARGSAVGTSGGAPGTDAMLQNSTVNFSSPGHEDIPGSQEAPPGRFSYLVSLRDNVSGLHFCVGTLVAPLWVLMPAHCIEGNGTGQTPLAFIGANNTTDVSGEERKASQIVMHPSWDPATGSGADLAMARLEKPVKNVAIPQINLTLALSPLLSVVGWPKDNRTSMLARSIRYADLVPVPLEVCKEAYGEDRLGSVVCVNGPKPDMCEGSSGGPLLLASAPDDNVLDGQPGDDQVVGIVSFGAQPCTEPQMPIVFTLISDDDVSNWIDGRFEESNRPLLSTSEQKALDEALRQLARSPENSSTQATVDSLLRMGADPNGGDEVEEKILQEAAMSDNLIVAKAVLAAGASVNDRTISHRETALHVAARENSSRVAAALINAGAKVNEPNDVGVTPLHFAALDDHFHIGHLLLVTGANWALRTVPTGETPLHNAASTRAPVVSQLLVNVRVDLDATNFDNKTALHIAANMGQVEVAAVLVMAGANQSAIDKSGAPPKESICKDPSEFTTEICTDEEEKMLMKLLSPVEIPEAEDEETLLLLAATPAEDSSAQDANALLDNGVNADACCNAFNGTALHETTRFDNVPVAQALLDAGANVSATDSTFQNTPMHDSARWNASGVLEVLITAGADVNAMNALNETPLHISAVWGTTKVADLLIANKALINISNNVDEQPLHCAARGNSRGVAALLVKEGADVNAKNFHGDTALHVAAAYGRLKLAQMLVESGADPSLRNLNGLSPFSIVCLGRFDPCLENQENVTAALRELLTEDVGTPPPNYSYVAAIKNTSGAHQCAGILVKEDWVLTSASCVELDAFEGSISGVYMTRVHLGVQSKGDTGREVMTPLNITLQNTAGDSPALALIQLQTASNHEPIRLVTRQGSGVDLVDDLALASGLGLTVPSVGDRLEATQLAFWPNADCNSSWPWRVQPNMWCAYGFAQECNIASDAGSPLVSTTASTEQSTQPILLGLVLGGHLCKQNRSAPAVFANVTAEETACWISETMQDPPPDICLTVTSSGKGVLKSEGIAAISAAAVVLIAGTLVLAVYLKYGKMFWSPSPMDPIPKDAELSVSSSGTLNPQIFPGSPWYRDDSQRVPNEKSPWETTSGFSGVQWPTPCGTIKMLPPDLEVELLGKEVGKGVFSRVEEGLLRDQRTHGGEIKVVVKQLGGWCMDSVDRAVGAFQNELEVLERVPTHPNIVKCYGGNLHYEDPLQSGIPDVYIVEELMDFNLSTLIHGTGGASTNGSTRKGPDMVFSHLLKIFIGMVAGLEHLHNNNVVHYDLKPANVLLDKSYNVKLADFGCSKIRVQSYVTAGFAGTMMYMAPECWFSKFVPDLHVRFQNIDVYSLGVVMWECITGNRPDSTSMSFPMEDIGAGQHSDDLGSQARLNSEMHVKSRFPMSDALPGELCELVWSCLAFENHKRPDCSEIRDKLNGFMSAEWANSFPARR